MLLENKASVNARDKNGMTPLMTAVMNEDGKRSGQNIKAASLLLENGADPRLADRDGKTALHQQYLSPAMADLLLQYDADPNAQDCFGDTPLHIAASRGNARLVETLLAHGAKSGIRNKNGQTPIQVSRAGSEVVSILEEAALEEKKDAR